MWLDFLVLELVTKQYFCARLEPICYFSSGPMSHMFLKIGVCNFKDCPETVGVVITGARERLQYYLILEQILYFETVHYLILLSGYLHSLI